MAEDPQSEFERIFGKTQKSGDGKSPEASSTPGTTQKLPTDSDLLGIRTDSDRFLVKGVPERLPSETDGVQASVKESNPSDTGNKSSQDAMTIALNVNVFANIADPKKAVDPKTGQADKNKASGTWAEVVSKKSAEGQAEGDGATFVIPLPKEPTKPGADIFKFPSPPAPASGAAAGDEFTRILHVEDSVKLPKPNFAKANDSGAGATIAVTNPNLPPAPPPSVPTVTAPGPSDFTKVVKGSELRALQEKLATAAANAPRGAATPAAWPPSSGPGQVPTAQPWQSSPQAPLPQYIPAPNNGAWPGAGPQSSLPPQSSASQQSMLSQYMPVLAALSVLILLAILLVVILKK